MLVLKSKVPQVLLCLATLYSSASFATEAVNYKDVVYVPRTVYGVVSILGGYANLKTGESESFTGTDDEIFSYHNSGDSDNSYVLGALVGVEWQLPMQNYFAQVGLEYNNFGSTKVHGTNTTGIEVDTSTDYNYHYHVKSQQLLVVGKILGSIYQRFHPYALVGLGAAWNRASGFDVSTEQTGSINLTPTFDSETKTSFSYALGLGVDMDLTDTIRLGLAYQFSDLGKHSLGDGEVTFNNYVSSVPFSLNDSHFYANQLIASVSFII